MFVNYIKNLKKGRRMSNKAAVVILVNENDEVLVLKRSSRARSFAGYWNFPGGSVEKNEAIEEAAVRELSEEAGLKTTVDNLSFFDVVAFQYLTVYFFITNKFSGQVKINDESTEYRWISLNEINDIKFMPFSKKMIKDLENYIGVLNE